MKTSIIAWVKAALVRAVKTAAQAAIGIIGASTALGSVDWILAISAGALAALVSALTSIAGIPEVQDGASIAKIAEAS
ncbi:MAG: holin [Gordonibacter sp.]|uniref:holin n=1 Tax=Gordonibacter sp. TaxID=1968902 RepID=UPI002FC81A5F